jgi:N-methylhydantoinase A
MPAPTTEQTATEQTHLLVGVDVGGTFTDLVAFDPATAKLSVLKLPSTPPDFHRAVIEAAGRACAGDRPAQLVHGSTVATNALLQRAGEPVAFVTTEGFRDMLLIGRQNRPNLYALTVRRPPPITPEENWFTVRERIDANGDVVVSLTAKKIDDLIRAIQVKGLRHVAVCLLFSFVNPAHEKRIGEAASAAGLSVSLSSDLLPEFREYERASTTAINASLRPTVQSYLQSLAAGLPSCITNLRISQSAGGTLSVDEAAESAAKLVLSGPAGGVMGAAWMAKQAGVADVITYDMGGTSTDVALVLNGTPQWTTSSTIDGLPIGLPMFDIKTVGAGGGSVAMLDAGGALRVGPRSAGAVPGPACYGRGGTEPTVTDANLVLGRIVPDQFLGGAMRVSEELAHAASDMLATGMGKDVTETALGIVRVAEANMAAAVRAVTSRRGHDPRNFALLSFGGAGGLHACAIAETLEIPRVIVPPFAGVLSALGMVTAAPVVDVARTVVHLGSQLDDAELESEYAQLSQQASAALPDTRTKRIEYHADVRFRGQSHELKVQVARQSVAEVSRQFHAAYRTLYGRPPRGRAVEIVTLRVRRIGHEPPVKLSPIPPATGRYSGIRETQIIDERGQRVSASVLRRDELIALGRQPGPVLLIDPEATTFVASGWFAESSASGIVTLKRLKKG